MATWPVSLPVAPLLDGFSYQPANTLVVSEMDAGLPKVRRRFTAGPDMASASWLLTAAQFETFRSFFTTDLAGGALSFTAEHPLPPYATATIRFDPTQMPTFTPLGNGEWKVDAQIMILPA